MWHAQSTPKDNDLQLQLLKWGVLTRERLQERKMRKAQELGALSKGPEVKKKKASTYRKVTNTHMVGTGVLNK